MLQEVATLILILDYLSKIRSLTLAEKIDKVEVTQEVPKLPSFTLPYMHTLQ